MSKEYCTFIVFTKRSDLSYQEELAVLAYCHCLSQMACQVGAGIADTRDVRSQAGCLTEN